MTYTSIMVHLAAGQDNAALLQAAASLARHFPARLIGLVTGVNPVAVMGGQTVDVQPSAQKKAWLEQQFAALQAQMAAHTGLAADQMELRCNHEAVPALEWICRESRAADLLICAAPNPRSVAALDLPPGELAMHAGRPVLMVPPTVCEIAVNRIMICWQDKPEARRIIANALPILLLANTVTVVEVATEAEEKDARDRLRTVTHWLRTHDVRAEYKLDHSGAPHAPTLRKLALDVGADLVVAGLYGHSRAQEWAAGGVSRDFLLRCEQCVLLAH
ncbi:universal stress protein [Amantichitinum ursilacus]|uniref:Universal stress protein family protein n=1 Tax=Amantichitinum ursilacus TaxID=857265 RepID=A0A0N0GQ97_9NEIS|nr:universal stress protein [Amantichitinum ursilacus]KPC54582.1 Universal stress protein family protein [Amantichitinum ursilacus]